jgi:hypothetical protein
MLSHRARHGTQSSDFESVVLLPTRGHKYSVGHGPRALQVLLLVFRRRSDVD